MDRVRPGGADGGMVLRDGKRTAVTRGLRKPRAVACTQHARALAAGGPDFGAWRLGGERDPSFHAGANEDGFFLGNDNPTGPFLFFDGEMPGWLTKEAGPGEGAAEALTRRSEKRILSAMEKKDRFRVILDGTRHESFSDRIFLCQFPRLARVGTRPAAEVHHIITSRLGDFFKRELGEKPLERNQEPDPTRQ